MPQDFVQILLGFAIVIVGAAGAYAIASIASFYKSKRQQLLNDIESSNLIKYNAIAKEAVHTVDNIVMNVVTQLDDTVKKELLAATSDGKLTDEEKTKLKNMALGLINEQISETIKDFSSAIIGNLDSYISTVIENCVTTIKEEKMDLDDDDDFNGPYIDPSNGIYISD